MAGDLGHQHQVVTTPHQVGQAGVEGGKDSGFAEHRKTRNSNAISFGERTLAGLKAARARGRKGGRPRKLQAKELKAIRALLRTHEISVQEIAARFGVSRSTLYRNNLT